MFLQIFYFIAENNNDDDDDFENADDSRHFKQ